MINHCKVNKQMLLIAINTLIMGFFNTAHAYGGPSNMEVRMDMIRSEAMRVFIFSILPFLLTFCLIIGSILLVIGILLVVLSRKNTSILIWGRAMIYGSISLILISRYIYPFIFPQVKIY